MKLLPQLDSEITEMLEKDISLSEIEDAIDDLNSGKSPGPDGLSSGFYKKFRAEVSGLLHGVFKESYDLGRLPPSFSKAHTVLIPKGESPEQLIKVTGYRPITLTNTDYKILMKVLARRLQSVIKELIGPHQTCGIKGRTIFSNIHVARSILEYCDADHRAVAMVQIDFEKAFDRVCHSVLFAIMDHVRVGAVVTEGIRMAYKNCTTNIIVNKCLTEQIGIYSSVRQGCPLSPLLFALYLEPLCARVIASSSIRGFSLQACEVKALAYADDVAFFCADTESVSNTLALTQRFCDVTGSKVNLNKCVGLWHGEWEETTTDYEGIRWFTTPSKYLGVPLDMYKQNTVYWGRRCRKFVHARWRGEGDSCRSLRVQPCVTRF